MSVVQTRTEGMTRHAILSEDGVYRYHLTRRWGPGRAVVFVMLNPSTADALVDDPTIRRCIGFARAWDFGALNVVNLYALRATNPLELWKHPEPTGEPINSQHIVGELRDAGLVVAAWGANARPDRVEAFHRAADLTGARVHHLGLTKDGAPRHPLYLRKDTTPTLWTGATS